MSMADKSVATDELFYPIVVGHNTCLEVARLEAVLNTLVEHKVDAMKQSEQRQLATVHASPRTLAKRLRITSSSGATTTAAPSASNSGGKQQQRQSYVVSGGRRCHDVVDGKVTKHKRIHGRKQRVSSSSPESARFSLSRSCERTPPLSDDDAFLHHHHYDATPLAGSTASCCCNNDVSEMHRLNDDYISLKIEELDDAEAEEEARRRAAAARRKRRRRRRKKRRLKALSVAVVEDVKVLDPDELPPRARWTIVATACLLLFMCLMLVGVTLRMAPLIDDMVRKENEELMHSLNLNPHYHARNATSASSSSSSHSASSSSTRTTSTQQNNAH